MRRKTSRWCLVYGKGVFAEVKTARPQLQHLVARGSIKPVRQVEEESSGSESFEGFGTARSQNGHLQPLPRCGRLPRHASGVGG